MERRDPLHDVSRAPAFAAYAREMTRRWDLPGQGSGPGAGDVLPKV